MLQQDSNSDRWSRRRARWPLDNHHGHLDTFFVYLFLPSSFSYCSVRSASDLVFSLRVWSSVRNEKNFAAIFLSKVRLCQSFEFDPHVLLNWSTSTTVRCRYAQVGLSPNNKRHEHFKTDHTDIQDGSSQSESTSTPYISRVIDPITNYLQPPEPYDYGLGYFQTGL